MWLHMRLMLFFASALLPVAFCQLSSQNFFQLPSKKCAESQFQCADGACISLRVFCDGKFDCADKSDEFDCGEWKKCENDTNSVQCRNRECISISSLCNGVMDCIYGEDESNCQTVKIQSSCPSNYFTCNNKICIPPTWVCDGFNDCSDGGDEISGCGKIQVIYDYSTNKPKCENDEFKCKNHKCVPKVYRCDGHIDCDDKSDEEDCKYAQIDVTHCTTTDRKFACDDHRKCINISQICDHVVDCHDGSDESKTLCSVPRDQHPCINCTHECVVTSRGPFCVCKKGFMLYSNNTCIDINECDEYGLCDHTCTNTPGSYNCSCDSAYVLQKDGHTCKIRSGEALLLYAQTDQINGLFLSSNKTFTIVDSMSSTVGVASAGRYIYWTGFVDWHPEIMRAESDGSKLERVVTTGLLRPEGIAVDWITMNIYFTDPGSKIIGVCSKSGYSCTTLHNEDTDKPRAIALLSVRGLMFWTDWGKRPLIARSGMDGSNAVVFVSDNVYWPNGVTIDEAAQRLYWVEAKLQLVETIKLDQSDRKTILDKVTMHPYSIVVFENKLYWSTVKGNEILSCNKFNGRDRSIVVRNPYKRIIGLHVHHHLLKYREEVTNPCDRAPCTDICMLTPTAMGLNYTCACPDGKILAANGYTCRLIGTDSRLLVAAHNHLFVIDYQTLGRPKIEHFTLSVSEISTITYDSIHERVIIFDSGSRQLLSYDLRSEKLFPLISDGLSLIHSLHFDEIGNNVYWCDWFTLTVQALSLNTGHRMVIVDKNKIETPYKIALAPELDYLFVAFHISFKRIEVHRFSMSGSVVSKKVLFEVEAPPSEFQMHYSSDLQRLFFTNGEFGNILSVDVNGQDRRILEGKPASVSLTSLGKMIFWVTSSATSLNIFSKRLDQENFERLQVDLPNYSPISFTAVRERNTTLNSPCAKNNGGCSDICLVSHQSKTNKICACQSGFSLSLDDVNCRVPKTCSLTEYECLTGECVNKQKECDGHEDCVHGDDESRSLCALPLINCPVTQFLCADKKNCIDKSLRCNGHYDCDDRSDENCDVNCTETNHKYLCASGECIDLHFRCDNKVDCKDGHDEINCHRVTCFPEEFRCSSGQCIPNEWECDSEPDCVDGSDESPKCVNRACYHDEFQCRNGKCVNNRLICNDLNDCGDDSDEKFCEYREVHPNVTIMCDPFTQFYCPSNRRPCLPIAARCNGTVECLDGSDEKNCTRTPCIDEEEFFCPNSRRCIPSEWVCDDFNDCGDNSDELEDACSRKKIGVKCANFQCKSGECVSLLKVCDNIPDCEDRSDEGKQCGDSCEKFGCLYKCIQTPRGPQCLCPNGFSLDPKNNKSCVDINECDSNICAQDCTNFNGSFKCSCYNEHYILRSDHVSCKAKGESALFLAASDISVDIFSINLKHKRELNLGTNLFRSIRAIDVDSLNISMFLLMEGDELWRVPLQGNRNAETTRLPFVTSFAHDWITQNIFYIENHVSIKITAWNSSNAVQIHQTQDDYMWALAIDPVAGYMFWFESHSNLDLSSGRIRRADLTGANPKTLIEDLDYGVRQLVIDSFGKHIYWLDRLSHTIHLLNYDGTHGASIKNIHTDAVTFTFFENNVYLVTRHAEKFGVIKCKIYGLPPRKCNPVKISLDYIHHLAIIHANRHRTISNPCYNVVCSGYCVIAPGGELMCKHFDGSLTPISSINKPKYDNDDASFGTILSCLIILCFIAGFVSYFYFFKRKSNPLQRWHFHNPIYNRPVHSDTPFNEKSSILNPNDLAFENPFTEEKHAVVSDLLETQKHNTPFLETLHEETTHSECTGVASCRTSTESLVKI